MGAGTSNWGSGVGEDGGDIVFVYVEFSDAVTPVARETLLGAWIISSSSI